MIINSIIVAEFLNTQIEMQQSIADNDSGYSEEIRG